MKEKNEEGKTPVEIKIDSIGSQKEIIILQGAALPPESPERLVLLGAKNTVAEFVAKYPHLITKGDGVPNDSFICVNIEKGFIELQINPFGTERDKLGEITSKLSISKELEMLGINSKYWDAKELGNLLRLNQHILHETNADPIGMIANLRNLQIQYEKLIHNANDNQGNTSFKKEQVIKQCNLPKRISFNIPLFNADVNFVIDTDVEVEPDSLKIILVCQSLTPLIQEQKIKLLKAELEKINALPQGQLLPIIYV